MNRRSFLAGLICAPAIVRPHVIMPVRVWLPPPFTWLAFNFADGRTRIFRSDTFEHMPGWVLDHIINPPVLAETGEPLTAFRDAMFPLAPPP